MCSSGKRPGVFLDVGRRIDAALAGPVYVQFEEDLVGIGVFDHVILDYLAFDLIELVRVVVVAETQPGRVRDFAYAVEIVAVVLQLGERRADRGSRA